jgi:phosphatase NudJ
MAHNPIPTWYFVLAIVRREDRFLLVHERKFGQTWYVPAGHVDFGESLEDAARRETLEETGIRVRVTGILRIEHTIVPGGLRHRVYFLAEPIDDTPPKSTPDRDSLGAAWVSIAELPNYALRGEEIADVFQYVARGGDVHPLELLQSEGAPFV